MTAPGHDYSWEPRNEMLAMAKVDAEIEKLKTRSWRADCAASVGFERRGREYAVCVYAGFSTRFQLALADMTSARFWLRGIDVKRTVRRDDIVLVLSSMRAPVTASFVVTETRAAIRECHRLFKA